MGEEEERTSEGTVQVPYPSFCFEQTSGAEGSERGTTEMRCFLRRILCFLPLFLNEAGIPPLLRHPRSVILFLLHH